MSRAVVAYLQQRQESAAFLLPAELARSIDELFPQADQILPHPYKIFAADETQEPSWGFPVADSGIMRDLESRLETWVADEVASQVLRDATSKEKAAASTGAYIGQLMKVAENALMSNLLNDYHAVFWLAHSFDLARHFSSIPRRVSASDSQTGRTQGDAIKYRIYQRWVSETRDAMTQIAARAASVLDGEEQRGLQFLRLLQDNVLVLTDEFIGPDLRELRSFITGYLKRDFQSFRDSFERLRATAADLLQRDRTFRAVLALFGVTAEQGLSVALLLDSRFQSFLFDYQAIQNALTREEREQLQLIGRRVREFAVLNQLRRGIVWMWVTPDGQVLQADKRGETQFSRSTRPMDFSKPGVVDPVIHRFGLIYDISKFSETLGNVRKGGGKEEVKSYRQMLLFQRKLENIAQRHLLQFEKFLGDGAFYTARRAIRSARAAIEIQRFYSEMKRKGFAFNRGLRIALNYGYYRLLPMKASFGSAGRINEFYGPGIVELSRLTTGKANKEIEEIAAFLVAYGYDAAAVQQFFAPLERGVDVIDHTQQTREFHAYLNANGTLVNEGIVASMPFLMELSTELTQEAQPLFRIATRWASYVGFGPAIPGVEYIGIRLLGMVSLKGLENVEVGEIVPFTAGEAEAHPIDASETLVTAMRHEYHSQRQHELKPPFDTTDYDTTADHPVPRELVVCARQESDGLTAEVLIGEWDPQSDGVQRPLLMPRSDFQRLFALKNGLTTETLTDRKESVRELYQRLSDRAVAPVLQLAEFRDSGDCEAFLLGETVEKL